MTARHPYDCHVRFTADEYRAIVAIAAREQRSITAQVRVMLSLAIPDWINADQSATKEG